MFHKKRLFGSLRRLWPLLTSNYQQQKLGQHLRLKYLPHLLEKNLKLASVTYKRIQNCDINDRRVWVLHKPLLKILLHLTNNKFEKSFLKSFLKVVGDIDEQTIFTNTQFKGNFTFFNKFIISFKIFLRSTSLTELHSTPCKHKFRYFVFMLCISFSHCDVWHSSKLHPNNLAVRQTIPFT